jgi:hypothetical protein
LNSYKNIAIIIIVLFFIVAGVIVIGLIYSYLILYHRKIDAQRRCMAMTGGREYRKYLDNRTKEMG